MLTRHGCRGWLSVAAMALALLPGSAPAEWQTLQDSGLQQRYLGHGGDMISLDSASGRYYVTVPLDLKFQEAANLSAASYVFQPRILVEDNSGAVVAEGTGNPPQPDGQYTLYSANLFFQCCPGQNSGDSDVPTTYWIVYMSADGTEGAMSYTYTTLRWAEPGGGNTGGNADGNTGGGRGGGFDCSCQDPATGRWYTTGSDLGGLNCPGIENATHVCE